MKTVNKYILASCVFCYFGGIYLFITKAGIMRIVSQYGIRQFISSEWPEDFPSLTVVYIGLIVYTILFAIITFCIYRAIEKHSVETDKLQQKSSVIHNYSEQLSTLVLQYGRICREKNIANKVQLQRFQLLQKQVSALSPSVFNDNTANDSIMMLINDLREATTNLQTSTETNQMNFHTQLSNIIENGIADVQYLQTKNITIS